MRRAGRALSAQDPVPPEYSVLFDSAALTFPAKGPRLAHWRKSKGKRAWDLLRQAEAEDRPLEAQTMRGFKALHKVLAHPHLASYLRGDDQGRCDLRNVV